MPTEQELEQMRAAMAAQAKAGDDTSALQAVYDLVSGDVKGPGDD